MPDRNPYGSTEGKHTEGDGRLKLKLFVKKSGCPLCHAAQELAPADTEVVDVGKFEGLAEYHADLDGLSTVPVLIVGEKKKIVFVGRNVIKHLRGEECDSETD